MSGNDSEHLLSHSQTANEADNEVVRKKPESDRQSAAATDLPANQDTPPNSNIDIKELIKERNALTRQINKMKKLDKSVAGASGGLHDDYASKLRGHIAGGRGRGRANRGRGRGSTRGHGNSDGRSRGHGNRARGRGAITRGHSTNDGASAGHSGCIAYL